MSRVGAVLLGALVAAGCLDPHCFENVDCPRPKICSPAGRCVFECGPDKPCPGGGPCLNRRCGGAGGPVSCPDDMVAVAGAFCVDRYEASRPDARENSAGTDQSRAVSVAGVIPWQVANNALAESACAAAGKRLCTASEWELACAGPERLTYAYGNTYRPEICNGIDTFGRSDFRLMPTGSFPGCTNAWGAFDLNGNLWEHTAGGSEFTIRGGAYNCSDSATLHRCTYVPGSWRPSARGFRCCRAPLPAEEPGLTPDGGDTEGGGCVVDDGAPDGGDPTDGGADVSPGDDGDAGGGADPQTGDGGLAPCPPEMVELGAICIDRYEASRPDADATHVGVNESSATSRPDVLPWYTDFMTSTVYTTFATACANAGKRLCRAEEFLTACRGPELTQYAYGSDVWQPLVCNSVETYCADCCAALGITSCPTGANCGYSSLLTTSYTPETCGLLEPYGPSCQVCYHVMPTRSFSGCTNGTGAFDLNGNVWETVSSTTDGRGFELRGGAFNCGAPAARFACTFNATWAQLYAGFRCCLDRGPP